MFQSHLNNLKQKVEAVNYNTAMMMINQTPSIVTRAQTEK